MKDRKNTDFSDRCIIFDIKNGKIIKKDEADTVGSEGVMNED